jgi:SAM-dependent methyltransferase
VKAEGLVLDLACGTGRHLITLSKLGYEVVGLDISVNLLKIAKDRWHGAQLIRGDMRFLPFKQCVFAAVISIDQSFGYLSSLKGDLLSLRELHIVLERGGVLIVDLFNFEYIIKQYQTNALEKGRIYRSFFLVQKRTIDASSGVLHDKWTIYDWVEGDIKVFEHITRIYRCQDMHNLLEEADFSINAVYGDYEMQIWTEDAKRLIFFAKAI